MEEEKTEIVRAAGIDRQASPLSTFGSYYANDTQVMTTPWDVRLTFGVIADVDMATKRAKIDRVAEVRMSVQHAKKLLEILTQQIASYEQTIGFIALPTADGK